MEDSFKQNNLIIKLFLISSLILIFINCFTIYSLADTESNKNILLEEPIYVGKEYDNAFSVKSKSLTPVGKISLSTNEQMTRTKEEIREKFLDAIVTVATATYFDEEPNIIGPDYKEGTLSELAISDTLKQLNFYRYLAGVNSVDIREENMSMNGKGAVLLNVSNFAHYPDQPSDMSDEFYEIAVQGTSYPNDWYSPSEGIYGVSGNVSSGIELTKSIGEYIDDTTNVVAASVGHRLSLLVPSANSVSFGYSNKYLYSGKLYNINGYTAITMFHGAKTSTSKFYTWPPAGNCPIEVTEPNEFWSVTLDSDYSVNYTTSGTTNLVDNTKETITLTYNNVDYVIDSEIYYSSSYNTIYFALPEELENELYYYDSSIYDYYSYLPDAKVDVNISGSEITNNSEEVEIDYYVEFFIATPINVESITLSETSLNLPIGTFDYTLTASVEPTNATYKDDKVWKSSDENVVYVDEYGKISTLSTGTATITVTCDGKADKCVVTVYSVPELIDVTEHYITLNKGDSYTIISTVEPTDADQTLTYSSSNENVVTVDSEGKLNAVGAGEAVITIKTVNELTTYINVTVNAPITDISVENGITLFIGETYEFSVEVVPEDTTDDKTLTWNSLNTSIATIDKNTGVVTGVSEGTAIISVSVSNGVRVYTSVTVIVPSVNYQIQVQDEGWHDVAVDGEEAARNISGHKMEAMKIWLDNTKGSIEYNLHLENRGWQGYKTDGTLAGIENGGLRAEALKIRLTGDIAEYYDVYYRVHIQNVGWLSWAKNDEPAGSSGRALRIEGLEVVLVKKGEEPPEMNPVADRNEAFFEKVIIKYQTHIQNIGWQAQVRNGATSGLPGRHLRIEGIKISKESTTIGGLSYQTHVQNRGWLPAVTDGQYSGTTGLGLRTEAVKISLTGDLADNFDVFYRIYVEDVGWLGWAKNGEEAGSTGYGKKLEGIEVKVYKKGDAMAPIQDESNPSVMNKE